MLGRATQAVRSVLGPRPLPAHGPWVHIYVTPFDQWSMDGRVPDWEGFPRPPVRRHQGTGRRGAGHRLRARPALGACLSRFRTRSARSCRPEDGLQEHPLTVRTTGPSQRRTT
jgi:hypothetical protein